MKKKENENENEDKQVDGRKCRFSSCLIFLFQLFCFPDFSNFSKSFVHFFNFLAAKN